MALQIASINSGSNGNCYYVGNSNEAVLIDVGISCREIEKRMKARGLSLDKVKAVFISHEHADHVNGLPVFTKKYQLPVYINQPVLYGCNFTLPPEHVYSFAAGQPVTIGSLTVVPFAKHHDAADPYSFVVEHNDVRVGVMTDIGMVCNRVIDYFSQCHAVFLESNYDEQMLEQGRYPYHLKRRISGGKGHLSNTEALQLFLQHKAPYLNHLVLSHLSSNNNHPDIVHKLFTDNANGVQITVASRYSASAVFDVTAEGVPATTNVPVFKPEQLQLFG